MRSTIDYLELLAKTMEISSDAELGRTINRDRFRIRDYRRKKCYLDNDDATRIAELLNINPLIVIADAEIERAKDEAHKARWTELRKKWSTIAASLLLISGDFTGTSSTIGNVQQANEQFIHYAKLLARHINRLIAVMLPHCQINYSRRPSKIVRFDNRIFMARSAQPKFFNQRKLNSTT